VPSPACLREQGKEAVAPKPSLSSAPPQPRLTPCPAAAPARRATGLLLPQVFVSQAGDLGVCSRTVAAGVLEQAFGSNLSPGCFICFQAQDGESPVWVTVDELFRSSSPFCPCQQPVQKLKTLPWCCRCRAYARPAMWDGIGKELYNNQFNFCSVHHC